MLPSVAAHAVLQLCIHVLGMLLLLACVGGNPANARVIPSFSNERRMNRTSSGLEILAVSGCERPLQPGRSRETYRCFANGVLKHPVTLTIRGRGFPLESPLRVFLRERPPIPLRCEEGNNECNLIGMECANVQRSTIFPQQILSCTLPHPSEKLQEKPHWLQRLAQDAIWMDVELQMTIKGTKNSTSTQTQKRVTIGVLSRAVQLTLTEENSNTGVKNSDVHEMFEDPLEYFFRNKDDSLDAHSQWIAIGIGGLKDQLHALYRRVFLSRLSSLRDVVEAVKIPHVRGVLLHGPPGNGKTLIARTVATLLDGSARVTIVHGADILSKYVGDSEKNLRKLFVGAEAAADEGDANVMGERHDGMRESGTTRQLHVIVIDEIESFFRRRGGSSDESSAKAVYDGLTNGLLALMDGLEDADNILVIGLTNQLHVIDRALLRPGRFEVVIEIPPPDLEGRRDMLFIHTRELREGHHLAPDVDLELLATRSGGFSGADVAGMVRAASSHALIRYRDALGKVSAKTSNEASSDTGKTVHQFQVSKEDFELAFQDILEGKAQITPGEQLGDNNNNNNNNGANFPLVDYDGSFSRNMNAARRLLQSILHSRVADAAVIIIYGPPGTGKTVLARELLQLGRFDPTMHLTGSVLYGHPHENPMDELIATLRDAVHTKGNRSIVIENLDHYLRGSGSMSSEVFKLALQEFRKTTYSQGASHVYGTAARTSSPSKKLLILATSNKELLHDLMHGAEYDLLLSLRLMKRKDIMPLLRHYSIIPPKMPIADEVVRAYPARLSYRQFLRITDLALWRAYDTLRSASSAGNDHDAALFSRVNAFFLQAGHGSLGNDNAHSLTSKEHLRKFAAAVQEVVSTMGLVDTFHDLLPVDDTVNGDEIPW
ncbi:putative vesicular-fusion ATPase-like protein [Trypanosoma rangeli]|uniref:Vesicle-fusing ATPase n=1 Tax=Trypanosoma rangeli TaxID=5698 RepID=A0A422MWC2_TRYRA|nr:putative vesicular-fusion ATPase-like protein [Trypanosoma rangeli]RNE97532.1 putative vesicular-fusion ATPase-like protein [Trypanosoma rangeli]|eukprot:RNE97532.1 putative vesicular-fusion ATPase-like protein [Trypanosoma rangeli]